MLVNECNVYERKKRRIMFFGESVTLAHVCRPFLLANSLDSEKFDVHFASDRYFGFVYEKSNFTYWPVNTLSPERFLDILKHGKWLYTYETLAGYIKEEIALLEKVKPDLVIGDMRLSLSVSAPLLNIPYIAITNGFWSPHSTQKSFPVPPLELTTKLGIHKISGGFGEKCVAAIFNCVLPIFFTGQGRGLNRLRKLYALEPFSDYLTGLTWGDHTLYADTPLVAPTTCPPNNHHYIGPVCWEPDIQLPSWWNEIKRDKPLAFVCLGSSGTLKTLPQILNALGKLNVNIVVATAGRLSGVLLPADVYWAEFLPGNQVVKYADIVITNGGSPSTYQALSEGVPVLGVPSNMDQLLSMSSVHRALGGIMIRSDRLDSASVEEAVRCLLNQQQYREAARRIAKEFSLYDQSTIFPILVDEILGLTPKRKVVRQ